MTRIHLTGLRRPVGAVLSSAGRGQERALRRPGLRPVQESAAGGPELASPQGSPAADGSGAEKKGRTRRRSRLLLGKKKKMS